MRPAFLLPLFTHLIEVAMSRSEILTPTEVARLFRVDAKTVSRWAEKNQIKYFRTPGGHRRYYRRDFDEYLKQTAYETSE
jgi:excisionase family DNA binding protein